MVADGNRRGYQHLLDAFWEEAQAHGLSLPTEEPISAASFCTARPKITTPLLKRLLYDLVANAFDGDLRAPHLWHGRRVLAVDGSKVNLQRSPDLEEYFGKQEGAYCPQALVSVMFDVCAKLPVDLEVSSFASCERKHLLAMWPSLQRGDVLVLDRGYPSYEVVQELCTAGVDFLIRVPASNSFPIVDELRESGRVDQTLTLELPKVSPDHWCPRRIRVVRIKVPDGTESYFITTLQRSAFTRRDLSELYHMRWEVEEFFKLAKGPYVGQGQFRSKSASGVIQEVHALVLFLAVSRVCMDAAARATGIDYDKLSQKAGVLGVAAYLTRVMLSEDEEITCQALRALFHRVTRRLTPKRSRPPFTRRSYRPRRRWGPSGRLGA